MYIISMSLYVLVGQHKNSQSYFSLSFQMNELWMIHSIKYRLGFTHVYIYSK